MAARTRSLVVLCTLALALVLAGCTFILPGARHSMTATPRPSPTTTPTATPLPLTISDPNDQTPPYAPFSALLAQVAGVGPVYVTGDQSVPGAALIAAGKTLSAMLRHRPDIAVQLRMKGSFTAVAARNESICDLPYFSQYVAQGTLCGQYGEGGAGGTTGHPVTACDERNLLAEPGDPYLRGQALTGQNICVHELAHTIMDIGLSPSDLTRIDARYLDAKAEGLWAGDYAMTNPLEFWAVMSQFYFSAGPNAPYAAFNHIANGPSALDRYDHVTFALLDSIYQGSTDLH